MPAESGISGRPSRAPKGKPAIAVLPFDNLGGDEATGRLADGITEDIITDLARFHDLDVIARNSTEIYKGKPVDVRQIGKDLNVGYVLEGSIQRQGDSVRVTGQLIDAGTGAHVWSERWDRPAEDVFAVQTEVAEKVAAALGGDLTMGQITRAELQRAKRLRPNDLTAYDYFQLGKEFEGDGLEHRPGHRVPDQGRHPRPAARARLFHPGVAPQLLDHVRGGCGDRAQADGRRRREGRGARPTGLRVARDTRVRADVPGPLGGGGSSNFAHPSRCARRTRMPWPWRRTGLAFIGKAEEGAELRRSCAAARSADDARQSGRGARTPTTWRDVTRTRSTL